MPQTTKARSLFGRALSPAELGLLPVLSKRQKRRMVVVGVPGDVPRALEHPAVGNGTFDVAAVLAVDVESDEGLRGFDQLVELLRTHAADAVLLAGPIGPSTMRRVADLALVNHCELLAVMPTEVLAGQEPVVVWSGDSPLVQLAKRPRTRFDARVKRAVDVVAAVAGLVIAAPILALLSTLIVIESPGAPLFRHFRVGRGGKRFGCLKLRTMRADAEDQLRRDPELYAKYVQNHYKLPDDCDPRVTPLGRFLRRTSLDELPQLWNVLVGDMSLVGPRPVVEDELANYGELSDLLLSVRPGLTGAWAVNGRHQVGYPTRCSVELAYVREWNLRLDAHILLRTAVVLTREAN